MTSREFCYFLQGYFELNDSNNLSPRQVAVIKEKLNSVFVHEIDQSFPDDQQQALTDAHNQGTVHYMNVIRSNF